jgi:lipoprotein-anchoring transpeptidase ErfK/SrfK
MRGPQPSRPGGRPRPRRVRSLGNLSIAGALFAAGLVGGWAGEGSAVRAVPVPFVVSTAPTGCGSPSAGDAVVESYLAGGRFGAVTRDGRLAGAECDVVRTFQRWAAIPQVTGTATATTIAVARRLAAVRTGSCGAPGAGLTVCVDLTTQTVWAIRGGKVALAPTVVRTGRRGQATPTGWFRIGQKKRHTSSSIYGTALPFWQRFYRDFGFHALETPLYAPIPGSHGCVNMIRRDAAALFALTSAGTRVHVFGRKPGT